MRNRAAIGFAHNNCITIIVYILLLTAIIRFVVFYDYSYHTVCDVYQGSIIINDLYGRFVFISSHMQIRSTPTRYYIGFSLSPL